MLQNFKIFKNKNVFLQTIISKKDTVLDVGFWGQGVSADEKHWPHKYLLELANQLDGIDLFFDEKYVQKVNPNGVYIKVEAESFELSKKYSRIVAADLIEHLVNPGLFLDQCAKHLEKDGVLILTTPNAFNLFNLAGKIMNYEPATNNDHTCYFNTKTITTLLDKCGWEVSQISYLYTLGPIHRESFKKKVLNVFYKLSSRVTPKYMETMVVVARPKVLLGS